MPKHYTKAAYQAQKKYDAAHTVGVYLKLNATIDSDILSHLDAQPNKQGYIKAMIRADMNQEARP